MNNFPRLNMHFPPRLLVLSQTCTGLHMHCPLIFQTHTRCYSLHPRHLLTPRGLISTHSAFLLYHHPIKLTTHIIVSLILSRRDLFLFNNSIPYHHLITLTTQLIVSLILSRRDLSLFNNNHTLIFR